MFCKIIFFIIFLIESVCLSAQNYTFWVAFADKNNSPYSVANPQEFLSERALQRREKQGISIDEIDLPVNPDYVKKLSDFGVQIVGTSRWLNGTTVAMDDTLAVAQIRNLTFVKMVQRTKSPTTNINRVVRQKMNVSESSLATDSAFRQKAVHRLNELHALGFCGDGVHVAVIDAGFLNVNTLEAFDSMRLQGRLLGTRDFVNPSADIFRQHTHCLAVLSSMAANQPNVMIVAAPLASYWLLRTEDAATESLLEVDNWVRAIEFADSVGVDVVNSSLGYSSFDDEQTNFTYADLDGRTTRISLAATMAARKGMLVVSSAGNDGANAWHYVSPPSDADSIITVGGVDLAQQQHCSFSSYGPTADGRVKPTLCSVGYDAFVMNGAGDIYGGTGTSFASPILAGAVACLWQALPYLTNMQLIDLLTKNASQSHAPDNALGFGIPDVWQAYCQATELKNIEFSEQKILPNPFSNYLNFELKTETQVMIFDTFGREIFNETLQTKLIDTSAWAQGVYVVWMRNEKGVFVEKLVKK